MKIRLLVILAFLAACSPSGFGATKTFDISADTLAQIKEKPYWGGNNDPGGFAAASLALIETGQGGILFSGFGPYLYELGFNQNVMITEIDGVSVDEIFVPRWETLRLQDPSAYDAAHYKDLIEYLFADERGDSIVLSVDVNASASRIADGTYEPESETWRLKFER